MTSPVAIARMNGFFISSNNTSNMLGLELLPTSWFKVEVIVDTMTILITGIRITIKMAPKAKPLFPKRLPAIASAMKALCLAAPCITEVQIYGVYPKSFPAIKESVVTTKSPLKITTA